MGMWFFNPERMRIAERVFRVADELEQWFIDRCESVLPNVRVEIDRQELSIVVGATTVWSDLEYGLAQLSAACCLDVYKSAAEDMMQPFTEEPDSAPASD